MKNTSRKSVFKEFGIANDFIEITEWTNGGGIDVSFSDRRGANFTWQEYDAFSALVKELNGDAESSDVIELKKLIAHQQKELERLHHEIRDQEKEKNRIEQRLKFHTRLTFETTTNLTNINLIPIFRVFYKKRRVSALKDYITHELLNKRP
jgi:hypothetical protein